MATFHGKTGRVYWDVMGTEITEATNWTLTATADVAEITAMQDTWKTYLGGFTDWTATVTGRADETGPEVGYTGESGLGYSPDYAGASDNKAKLDLYFKSDTGDFDYVYGDAICVGIAHTVDSNDVGMVTYTFQGSGALTAASAASAHSY